MTLNGVAFDPATAQRHVYADAPPSRMDDPLWQGERFMGDGGPLNEDAGAAGGAAGGPGANGGGH